LFVHVTEPPALIVTSAGLNAKLAMVTAVPAPAGADVEPPVEVDAGGVVAAGVDELEQPATASTSSASAAMTTTVMSFFMLTSRYGVIPNATRTGVYSRVGTDQHL
jgi:mRNA-degrading endonuclease toxin of MazEF toxin-antitoxin module